MPSFAYRAVDPTGRRITGHADAADDGMLTRSLETSGLVVLDIAPVGAHSAPEGAGGSASRGDVLEFTRTLAALLPAGMPLARALAASRAVTLGAMADVVMRVRERVERGDTFASALAEHAGIFSPLYLGLVRAGERSGDVAGAMARLRDQLEREEALRARVVSAMMYPLLLAIAGGGSIVILMAFVLPRFAELLSGTGAALPRSTAMLLGVSAAVRTGWPLVLAGVVALVVAGSWFRSTEEGRAVVSRVLLALPLVGGLRRRTLAARFARLLGVLLAGGAPLLQALDDTIESLGDPSMRDLASRIKGRVREGTSLAAAVAESPLFPPMFVQLVTVGEESGQLQPFLLKAAEIFEEQADRARQRLVSLAEPAMIVVFGGIVGFVALSLLQAVYGMNAETFR